jgi:hypothetical protein
MIKKVKEICHAFLYFLIKNASYLNANRERKTLKPQKLALDKLIIFFCPLICYNLKIFNYRKNTIFYIFLCHMSTSLLATE